MSGRRPAYASTIKPTVSATVDDTAGHVGYRKPTHTTLKLSIEQIRVSLSRFSSVRRVDSEMTSTITRGRILEKLSVADSRSHTNVTNQAVSKPPEGLFVDEPTDLIPEFERFSQVFHEAWLPKDSRSHSLRYGIVDLWSPRHGVNGAGD